ncbi:MAG: efflux RND transporter periplasmic adaptor subunit [Anaerolineales bacterium]|nr:efflux RND transporter periplasmic adaptor subunit [Anaerolineales bacterium]
MSSMKKVIPLLILLVLVGVFALASAMGSRPAVELETETLQRGTLSTVIDVDGVVQSSQSALLFWNVSGEIDQVNVQPGDRVTAGEIITSLEPLSLPSYVIAAQAELISAQRALENLLESKTRQAEALKTFDQAQQALEDGLHPEKQQAQALVAIAEARQSVEHARRQAEITASPASQSAIDQAYANLLLAKDKMENTADTLEKLENAVIVSGPYADLVPKWMIASAKHDIRRMIKQVEFLLVQDTQAYEKSLARYTALITPPDPIDVAAAEAELASANARLTDAQREWEKIKDGTSPAALAVLQAELEDAQRAWARLENGPHPDDIIVLETQIAAAEAAVKQMKIQAPFSGTLMKVEVQPHDLVEPGTLAVRIDDLSHLYVNVLVSEIDVNRIQPGQKAALSLDAVFAKQYQGEVVEIAMVGTQVMGSTNFNVKVEILEPDADIKLGMTASIQIIVDQIEDVLLVPSQAIRSLNGAKVVYRVEGQQPTSGSENGFNFTSLFQNPDQNQIQPVRVTIGTTSSPYSEIKAGEVQVGDLILLDPPSE